MPSCCNCCDPYQVFWVAVECSYEELQPVAFVPWHCWAASNAAPSDVGLPAKITHGQCSCQSQLQVTRLLSAPGLYQDLSKGCNSETNKSSRSLKDR
jgi:hypothetical protein